MKFATALKKLAEGCKIQRGCWKDNIYYQLNTRMNYIECYEVDKRYQTDKLIAIDDTFKYEDVIATDWKVFSNEDEDDYTCFEVETEYKNGKCRSECITAKDETAMWSIYDRKHRSKNIVGSAIIDAWPL